MTIQLTKEKVRTALKWAIEVNGDDYIIGGDDCVYVEEGTGMPSCILGHVLIYLGVDAEAFVGWTATTAEVVRGPRTVYINTSRFDSIFKGLDVEFPEADVFPALVKAQEMQDERETWGAAVTAALAILEANA